MGNPLKNAYEGFREMFTSYRRGVTKTSALKRPSRKEIYNLEEMKKSATVVVRKDLWGIYHHFKKHHGMLNW